MKRGIIVTISVFALLIAALLIGPGFVDWSRYKAQAQSQIKTHTGLDAEFNGAISLALLPFPHVLLEDVKIKAPQGGDLVTLGRLEVNVDLVPLLSGDIVVNSVELVKPDIAIEVLKDGRPNWKTPEIEALFSKDKPTGGQESDFTQAVSLRSVKISSGRFAYKGQDAKQPFMATDINLDIGADTLIGPFVVKGDVVTSGQTISVDAKVGEIKPGAQSTSLKADMSFAPAGAQVSYAGVVGLGGALDVQGETAVSVPSLAKTLASYNIKNVSLGQDSLAFKGILTATPEKVEYKNMSFALAGNQLKGNVAATLAPINVTGSFQASEILNVDAFLGAGQKKDSAGGLDALLNIVPETLSMPMPFETKIDLALPGLVYNKNSYSDVAIGFAKQDKSFKIAFAAQDIPGKGQLEASANLSYAAKSLSEKTGAEVYSEPSLVIDVTGKTQNMPYTVAALTGLDNLPYLSTAKTGHFDINAALSPSQFTVKDSVLKLDNTTFGFSGAYSHRAKRPLLKIVVNANALDMAAFASKEEKAGAPTDYTAVIKALSLPYDLDFTLGAQSLKAEGYDIKGARLEGAVDAGSIKLRNAAVEDFAGAKVSLSGGIGDVKMLSGVDLAVKGETSDIRKLAEAMKWDVSSLPQSLKAAKIDAKASGDINVLAVNANVQALDGQFIAKGKLGNPLGGLAIDNLAVQVKHANMARAMRMFAPGAPNYTSLAGPMDLSADIKRDKDLTTLSNIKGNLAGASVAGAVSYNTAGAVPLLTGDLKFGDLELVSAKSDSVRVTPSAAGGGGSTGSGGRWSREAMDLAWMRTFDANLNVTANRILYQVWDMQNPVLALDLKDGKLNVSKLEAGLFDGQVAMTATLNAPSDPKNPVSFNAAPSVTNVSLEPLVKALAGNAIIRGKGRINMKTQMSAIGLSQEALVRGLRGDGTVTGSDLVLEGFDVTRFAAALSEETKPGDTLLGLWKGVSKGGSTAFDTLDGAFTLSEGVANISKLDLDGAKAYLKTTGSVDLNKSYLKTAHTITLKGREDVPPFTINVAGPLDNPGQTFAQGALQDYFSRKLNRKLEKILTDKLGLPSGAPQQAPVTPQNGTQAPQQQQEVTPEQVFRGLLEGLIE